MILEKNSKSAKTGKSGHFRAPTPQRKKLKSRRRPTPRHVTPLPQRGRGAKMAPLEYANEGLCHSVSVLRRGVSTVHNKKFLDFVSEHLVFIHR